MLNWGVLYSLLSREAHTPLPNLTLHLHISQPVIQTRIHTTTNKQKNMSSPIQMGTVGVDFSRKIHKFTLVPIAVSVFHRSQCEFNHRSTKAATRITSGTESYLILLFRRIFQSLKRRDRPRQKHNHGTLFIWLPFSLSTICIQAYTHYIHIYIYLHYKFFIMTSAIFAQHATI